MQYKTIILELVQQQTALHDQLRNSRMLLSTIGTWAEELKRRHESWKGQLSQAKPGSDPQQIESEALELALSEVGTHFSCELPPNDPEPSHSTTRCRSSEITRRTAKPIPPAEPLRFFA